MSLTNALAQLALAAEVCAREARLDAATADDALLLDQQRQLSVSARLVEMASCALAAEIAHRSRRELGYDGLAQKMGARTPEALVQQVTGASSPTARRLVHVGTMIASSAAHDEDPLTPVAEPWLAPALRAASTGALSSEAIEVIRTGLGAPGETVTPDALAAATAQLTALAPTVTLELLAARARELRDDLDSAGVAEREEQRRERRFLHLYPQRDGMTRISGLLDPESAAILTNAVDAATSPRRGGPRFVDPDDVARAEALLNDSRTTEQIALDALVELVDIAVRARDTNLLGVRRADVRLLVSERDLTLRTGIGFIEGQKAAVSIATVERHACDGGYVPIVFNDNGQSLNLGQTQRFHNARQRTAIAARDGGCLAPDCDRPPSWTEVHHINEYSLGGKTDLHDGVLLCRHHHLMTHNNGWRVTRERDRYWFIPPPDIDARQTPIPLRTKNPAMRRLLATA